MEKVEGKESVRCRAKWEWVSEEPTNSEGAYVWIGGEGGRRDDGVEVVKSLSAVVADAGKS